MNPRVDRRRRPDAHARWRHAGEVLLRTVIAVVGGYVLAHAFSALAASLLPLSRPDRVITGMLLAFPVWCAAAVYSFGARRWTRAAAVVPLLALALLAAASLLSAQAMRP
ncbi:DUF3649 domain-containing protein [Luteimonas sp. WGS1318]|uniref:DUF3649 domain-containing protein n=1 Tax=Luteimonas sp. WGS1318 TaxID=3366815 RepID=UPI00372D1032